MDRNYPTVSFAADIRGVTVVNTGVFCFFDSFSKKWFKSAEGIPIKMNEANKDSAQQCIDLATRALRVGTPPIALKSTAMLC